MERERIAASGGLPAVVLAAMAFSWGIIIVKALGLPAATIAFFRLLVGATALATVSLLWRLPGPRRFAPVIGGGVSFGIHQLLFNEAAQRTSVAIVTLIQAMQPLLVAAVSHSLVRERPSPSLKWWALVALGGVAVVVWANLDDSSRSLGGDLLAVADLVFFTAFFLFNKRARQQGTHTVTVTAWMLGVAMVVVAPALLWVEAPTAVAGWQWGLLALLALGPGNGHLLVNWAHRRVTAASSSLVLTAVPLLSSIWAYLVFDEPYGWRHVGGMLIVVVAIEGARRAELAAGRKRVQEAQSEPAPAEDG